MNDFTDLIDKYIGLKLSRDPYDSEFLTAKQELNARVKFIES